MSETKSENINFIVDTRERGLIDELTALNAKFTVEQLELGDILFKQGDDISLIIERKTIADLKASICDGRAREQKARLLGSVPAHRILYLVEGSLNKSLTSKVSGLPVSTLLGSIINTQLRDGIRVYKTTSLSETANFLVKLYSKLEQDGDKYFRTEEMTTTKYTASLKKSKKANMTPSVWFRAQLALIPQVTEKVADVIIEKYSSPRVLMAEYENTPEHLRAKLLADLKYPIKNDKVRRVGTKMSQRIYEFFFGIYETE